MITAGPITTSDDSAVTAISDTSLLGGRLTDRHLEIINAGTAAGFYTVDGGANWAYLPENTAVVKDMVDLGNDVQLKRVAGGANLADVYVHIW
jgi:hypothetical protein